jgi:hypothetical protein
MKLKKMAGLCMRELCIKHDVHDYVRDNVDNAVDDVSNLYEYQNDDDADDGNDAWCSNNYDDDCERLMTTVLIGNL